jgi:hypothetical protein
MEFKMGRYYSKTCLIIIFMQILLFADLLHAQTNSSDFETVLNNLDSAIENFLNGEAKEFKNFWSHSDDITIAGGFGGEIEKGWESISKRLDRVNSVYSKAVFETKRISYDNDDKFGYLVQQEQIKFFGKDENVEMKRDYRVTMLFRFEEDEWKLIHRHADTNTSWNAPE